MVKGDKCDTKKIKQEKGNVGCWHAERVPVLDTMAPEGLTEPGGSP